MESLLPTLESRRATLESASFDLHYPPNDYSVRGMSNEEETSKHENENSELELSKTASQKITNSEILIRNSARTSEKLPSMGAGRDYPPNLPTGLDQYMVVFDGDTDPMCPLNWPIRKKMINSISALFVPLAVQIGSAIFSPSLATVSKVFGVGHTVAVLSTSLYIFGFAGGPVLWGPLSEVYGRRPIFFISSFGFLCFAFATATAKDIQTLMICRFFCGFIGAAGAVTTPSSLSDVFSKSARGKSMTAFGLILFGAPMIAPILGGFTMKNSNLSWRWPLYFTGFWACVSFVGILLFCQETHHPTILVNKAEELRRRTGNRALFAAHEEVSLSFYEIGRYNILRPLIMLVTEPILFLMSLYNAFVYGMLYLLLTAVTLVFGDRYRFSQGVAELPYLSLFIGVFIGGAIILFFDRHCTKKMQKQVPVFPESRVPPMLVGSILFPMGMFWFGWSGDFPEKVHWIVPTIGSSFIGIGLITIFLPCLTYIVDSYTPIAASALALNAFLRASFGGAFPLFATQMFNNMGIKWATTLIGCFASLMIPVPFVFYKFGPLIRNKSKNAV